MNDIPGGGLYHNRGSCRKHRFTKLGSHIVPKCLTKGGPAVSNIKPFRKRKWISFKVRKTKIRVCQLLRDKGQMYILFTGREICMIKMLGVLQCMLGLKKLESCVTQLPQKLRSLSQEIPTLLVYGSSLLRELGPLSRRFRLGPQLTQIK